MEFKVKKASNWSHTETIEINNLEELKAFQQPLGCDIIVSFDDDVNNIIIHDDYVE